MPIYQFNGQSRSLYVTSVKTRANIDSQHFNANNRTPHDNTLGTSSLKPRQMYILKLMVFNHLTERKTSK